MNTDTTETPATATHTPGPWRYEAGTKTVRAMPSNYWLATMDSWDGSVNNHANARLIAAAPELLAALKESLTWMKTHKRFNGITGGGPLDASIDKARAAIAKAT